MRLRSTLFLCQVGWALATLLAALVPAPARAELIDPEDEITVQANVYDVHYRSDPEHLRYSPLIGAELRRPDGWLVGGALFRNSFGQFSQTVYGGYLVNLVGTDDQGLYAKLAVGVIHGYTGRYRNKIPYNHGGFAPGVIPALGYRWGMWRVEAQVLGVRGLMVTAGVAFKGI
jgi:hypothetical protein